MTIKILTALSLAAALFLQPAGAQTNSDPALDAILKQVNDKIIAGKTTEADFEPELKQFDALAVAHKKDPSPDAAAQVVFLKARVYLEVLHDIATGSDQLEKIKTDYPGTPYATNAAAILQQIDEQLKAMQANEKLDPSVVTGQPFPDFTEKDLSGDPISVSALKGKVVLIDFWATWCPPCLAELPNVTSIYKAQHKNGLEVISVSADDSQPKLEAFLKAHGDMVWPQIFDDNGPNSKLQKKYAVSILPCTILIGRDGKVAGSFLRGKQLQAAVAEALAAK